MKRKVDYKRAWKKAMAELNKSIKFHKYYCAEAQLKEFSGTMKEIRKKCTKQEGK